MDFKGLLDKAKDAATAAKEAIVAASEHAQSGAAPAPEAAEPGTDVAAAAPEQAMTAANPSASNVGALAAQKLSELTALGAEKVQELVSSFQGAIPAISSAGYELTEFEIELGVTPKLIPHFRYAGTSAEDVAHAREALRDNKLGALILGALLRAGEVHKQIKVAGFRFSHIEVELGLIPSVRLQYKNDAQDAG